jgi:ferrochelatase
MSRTPAAQYRPQNHPLVRNGRIGVLLLNLGTPDATDYWSMRRYLKEFLSDRRVIEEPRLKWWLILNLIILTVRPGRKGKDYAKIWNRERNEGPLKTITRSQAEKLYAALKDDQIVVDWAMRYANPTVAERISHLQTKGCDRVLLVPLYPQYAALDVANCRCKAANVQVFVEKYRCNLGTSQKVFQVVVRPRDGIAACADFFLRSL